MSPTLFNYYYYYYYYYYYLRITQQSGFWSRGFPKNTKRIKNNNKIKRRSNDTISILKSYAYCSGMSIHVLKWYARQCSSSDRLNWVLLFSDCNEWGNVFHNKDEWKKKLCEFWLYFWLAVIPVLCTGRLYFLFTLNRLFQRLCWALLSHAPAVSGSSQLFVGGRMPLPSCRNYRKPSLFCLTSYPGEISHSNLANPELYIDESVMGLRRWELALHTSSHLTPTEAWRRAVIPVLCMVRPYFRSL